MSEGLCTPRPADWTRKAACANADRALFFPSNPWQERQAKLICSECPVRLDCLDYARSNRETSGVFGGKNFERKRHGDSDVWELFCRRCEKMFEHPVSRNARPWYCSETCRAAARSDATIDRNRRYRGNAKSQPVGL